MKKYWKVFCEDDEFPGLWQRWFKDQCAAVGWCPKNGFTLGDASKTPAWSRARNALKRVEPGDLVVVQLKKHRVARVGEVVRTEIQDRQWNPSVPPTRDNPVGGKGRRIAVRWNLNLGPDGTDTVVLLPVGSRLPPNLSRPTICELDVKTFQSIIKAMADERSWVGLQNRFISEQSLSDYIAAYPGRLEDGLLPYPNAKVREKVFPDGTRSDVLLIDRNEIPIVVECKQGEPTLNNIKQLRGYMAKVKVQTGTRPRGILVHGGAANLRDEVRRKLASLPSLETIRYDLIVRFGRST